MLSLRTILLTSLFTSLFLVACSGGASSTLTDPNPNPNPGPSGSATGEQQQEQEEEKTTSPATPTTPAQPSQPAQPTTPATPTTPPTIPTSCNVIDNDADAVGVAMVASAAPNPKGGPVVDGKYHLTNVSLYTGAGGSTGPLALSIKQTINLKNGIVEVIEEANGKITRLNETFTTTGTTANFAPTCPAVKPGSSAGYSSQPDGSLILFLENDLKQTVAYTYSP